MNKEIYNIINMIEAFECDFNVSLNHTNVEKDEYFILKLPLTQKLLEDINLLQKFSFDLRHNNLKIISAERLRKLEILEELWRK